MIACESRIALAAACRSGRSRIAPPAAGVQSRLGTSTCGTRRRLSRPSSTAIGPSILPPFDRLAFTPGRSSFALLPGVQAYQRQLCRSLSAASTAAAAAPQQQRWRRVRLFAKAIKYARIPALILSVYGLGYQQGIIDYSRDPDRKQDDLLGTILAGVGCVDRDEVRTSTEGSWSKHNPAALLTERDRQFRRVGLVGEKITAVAKKYVEKELKRVMEDRTGRLPAEITENEERLYQTLLRDEEFQLWAKAKQRMDGRWKYLLIKTSVPNAFVSELLPQRVFVTTSMMEKFIANDSEMALVLGHEISHLILGHVSDSNTLSTMLKTLEVLLLSIDPSEGFFSLGVMSTLATVRTALVAANSRENETAADAMGIKLAAMACYDTKAASAVFDKMHQHDTESGEVEAEKSSGGSLLSFIDTHPPSDERYDYLLRASEEENAEKYEDTHRCGSIRRIFKDVLSATKKESEKSEKEGEDEKEVVGSNGGGTVRDRVVGQGLRPTQAKQWIRV